MSNLRLENTQDYTMLILGEREPELAVALNAGEARKLAAALEAHATDLERSTRRVVLPGEGLSAG